MVKHDFHESYYDHNCTVTDTEDVLETEFPGNSLANKVKRWWFDWFLVSYSDERARMYFNSSYAMRMERYRQYRNFRNRIHPLSKFRSVQEVFMFTLFVVNCLVFHHNMSITFGQIYVGFYYLGAIIELITIGDVIVHCCTGYIDTQTGNIILEKRLGLLHYGSTKLFIHVASALPLQCVLLMRYGGDNIDCTLCKINNFIITLKFLSVFALFRLYEHSRFLTFERNSYKLTHFLKLMRIYFLGVLIMLYYIDLTDDVTLMCMISNGTLIDSAYVSGLIVIKYVNPNPPSNYRFFIQNFGRITKSIFLFNLGFSKTKYHIDILTTLGAFLIANTIFLWQIVECHNFLFRKCFLDDKVIKMKQALENVCHCRQLPDKVTKKIVSYYDYKQSKVRAMEKTNHFIKALPDILKRESMLTRHIRHIRRIPFFAEWPIEIVEDIVLMLKQEIYLTNDLVAEPWVQSEGLLVVGTGELAVYKEDKETGHLIDGDYFGEMSLVTDREERTVSVVAISSCVMLLLEKSAFRAYMRKYPRLFMALKREILMEDNSNETY